MISAIPGLQNTAAALTAERTRLEVIAQNIANVNTSRDVDGKPYQRRTVVFENVLQDAMASSDGSSTPKMQVATIRKDSKEPRMVYQPGHPDADSKGMVALPDINIHQEMADLIVASRAFEANLAVVKNARSLAMQTLAIGKR